jgi:hypothetical protein
MFGIVLERICNVLHVSWSYFLRLPGGALLLCGMVAYSWKKPNWADRESYCDGTGIVLLRNNTCTREWLALHCVLYQKCHSCRKKQMSVL